MPQSLQGGTVMGRYSIIVKTEEVRRRVQAGKFDSAMKVVETIPLKS